MNEVAGFHILKGVRDSVSRIIENLGFTAVERAAHDRLCDMLLTDMSVLSSSLRILMENAQKTACSLNPIDIAYTLKYHQFDLDELVEYAKQVEPFPPGEEESVPSVLLKTRPRNENILKPIEQPKAEPMIVEENRKGLKTFEIPKFDNMDEFELGFAYHKPVIHQKPANSKPIQLRTKRAQVKIVEEFNNNYFTPLVNRQTPTVSKSCHQLSRNMDLTPKMTPKVAAKEVTATVAVPKPIPLTKVRSRLTVWKRKMIERNHEQRLRDEMIEREKEHEFAKKRHEEKRRMEQLRAQRRVEIQKAIRKEPKPQEDSRIGIERPSTEANLELKSRSVSIDSDAAISGECAQPLPKIRIKFERIATDEIIVKRVATTRYRKIENEWRPVRTYKNLPTGVSSRTARNTKHGSAPLPVIVLKKFANGTVNFARK